MLNLLPLSNVRILDLTMVWAGPHATRLLADLGAEVIKIETAEHWDLLRALHQLPDDVPLPYNKSAFFNHNNRNKFGCTLNLKHPEGRALFLRLVAQSDVVIENFRTGVMEGLGLTFEALQAANPDIILVSLPAHGKSGPEAGYIAYGTHIEQLAGLVSLTGYEGGEPHRSGISYGDPIAGATAAAAVITALFYRRFSGEPVNVEVAQREAMMALIGEYIVGYSMNGIQPPLLGNRDTSMAPHGVFPCAGEDAWVTIAVASDAEFEALCRVIGRPELVDDPRFADVVSRYRNQAALEPLISEWTRPRSHHEAAALLQAAGVPAAPVFTVADLLADPHLRARGFFEPVAHPDAGIWDMDGPVWKLSRTPAHIRLPAPAYAEHNDYVFRYLLGLDDREIARLTEEGIISTAPDLRVHQ